MDEKEIWAELLALRATAAAAILVASASLERMGADPDDLRAAVLDNAQRLLQQIKPSGLPPDVIEEIMLKAKARVDAGISALPKSPPRPRAAG